jgi:hypothetical protein
VLRDPIRADLSPAEHDCGACGTCHSLGGSLWLSFECAYGKSGIALGLLEDVPSRRQRCEALSRCRDASLIKELPAQGPFVGYSLRCSTCEENRHRRRLAEVGIDLLPVGPAPAMRVLGVHSAPAPRW